MQEVFLLAIPEQAGFGRHPNYQIVRFLLASQYPAVLGEAFPYPARMNPSCKHRTGLFSGGSQAGIFVHVNDIYVIDIP